MPCWTGEAALQSWGGHSPGQSAMPPSCLLTLQCCPPAVFAVAVPKLWVWQCSSAEKIQLSLTGLDGGVRGRRELRMGSGRQSEVLLSVSVLGL